MRLDRTSSAAPNTELLRTTEQTRRQDRGAAIEPVVGVHERELERPRLELGPAERADVYAEIEPLRVEPRRPRHVPVQLQHPPERRRRGPRRHPRPPPSPLADETTTPTTDPGLLHFYHYNELHSSDYHYYDVTYIYTIREKFDLQIYHI